MTLRNKHDLRIIKRRSVAALCRGDVCRQLFLEQYLPPVRRGVDQSRIRPTLRDHGPRLLGARRFQLQRYKHVTPPKLLVGKTVSLRAALAHFKHERVGLLEKIIGALIDFSPHSLVAAYIPNLK